MADYSGDGHGQDGQGEEEHEQEQQEEKVDEGGPRISQEEKIPAKYLQPNEGARTSSRAWNFVTKMVRGEGHPFRKPKSTHVCVHEIGKNKWCNTELNLSKNSKGTFISTRAITHVDEVHGATPLGKKRKQEVATRGDKVCSRRMTHPAKGGKGAGGAGGAQRGEKTCSVRFFRGSRIAVERGQQSETLWDVAVRASGKPGQDWLAAGATHVSIKFLEEESCGKEGDSAVHSHYRVSVAYAQQATLADFDEAVYGQLKVWVTPDLPGLST